MIEYIIYMVHFIANLHIMHLERMTVNQLFDMYDADGSGTVEVEELQDVLKDSGWSCDDVANIFADFDEDDNCALDRAEFIEMFTDVVRQQEDERRKHGVGRLPYESQMHLDLRSGKV